MPSHATEIDSDVSWAAAKRAAALVGPIPAPYNEALRLLWKSHEETKRFKDWEAPEPCIKAIRTFERVQKLRVPLELAASSLFPDRAESLKGPDQGKALLQVLRPGLFSVILFITYIQRRASKLTASEDWQKVLKELLGNIEIGFLLGSASSELGEAEGMLVGAIRHLALAPWIIARPAEFTKFRRQTGRKFDSDAETALWGCDHAQVGALLISMLGLRRDVLEMGQALRKVGRPAVPIPEDLQLWRSALFVLDHFKSGLQSPPEEAHSGKLKISQAALDALRIKSSYILEHGSSFEWLTRRAQGDPRESST